MGTEVLVLVPAEQAGWAVRLVEGLFAEREQALSRFRPDSELSRLNGRAGAPVEVSPTMLEAVDAALGAARDTAGLFDPTLLHDLVHAGYDRPFELLPRTLETAERTGGGPRGGGAWRNVVVDHGRATVTLPPGCALDLGGVAKGMAVDAAVELLEAHAIGDALVSAGGDLRVLGLPPDATAWPVAVGDGPDAPVVPLVRGALATSGSARRRWVRDGVGRHHLIDPRTGEPARTGLRRVTVAASSCRAADVAATAAFVAGPLLARGLLERHRLAGLLVTELGREIRVGRWPSPTLSPTAA